MPWDEQMNALGITKSELAAVTVLSIGVIAGAVLWGVREHTHAPKGEITITAPDPARRASAKSEAGAITIAVHVAGDVAKPGLVELPMGSRVADAIKLAGGAKPGAYLDGVNLAALVRDGEQIYVPAQPTDPADGGSALSPASGGASSPQSHGAASGPKALPRGAININTASKAVLMQLPGVGEVTGDKIIAKRKELGRFASPEQLLDVDGIGPKKYAKMKPYVRVQ